jgi:hypothetical protein
MDYLFQFEQDGYYPLRRMVMVIRFKLDACGIKLSIHDWSKLSRQEREHLAKMPYDTAEEVASFKTKVEEVIEIHGLGPLEYFSVETNPAWQILTSVPVAIINKAAELTIPAPSVAQWATLSQLQRFTLVKHSREGHKNKYFYPAMKEFGLV